MTRLLVLAFAVLVTCCQGPRYVVADDQSTPEQFALVRVAAERWNAVSGEVLGVDVFVVAGGDASVTFSKEEVYLRCGDYASHARGCAELGGYHVWINPTVVDPSYTVAHELGHLLGLLDRGPATEEDDGIMTYNGSHEFNSVDREALQSTYGR